MVLENNKLSDKLDMMLLGIKDATEQLKSYMQSNDKVRYGVVTDGLELVIFIREGEVLNDIPKCAPNFPSRFDGEKTLY